MSLRRHDDLELMSRRRLSDSLEATRTMLRQSQEIARETQATLVSLAAEFCGAELQARQERDEDPQQIPAGELAAMLRARFKSLKLAGGNGIPDRLAVLDEELRLAKAEAKEQRLRADAAEGQVELLERQVAALERSRQAGDLSSERRTANPKLTSASDGSIEEEINFNAWLETWQATNRSYERDVAIVTAIGDTGGFFARDLERTRRDEGEMSRRTIRRAIQACADIGLLEKRNSVSTGGRPAQVLLLTGKGAQLYRCLMGKDPKPSQHVELLKAHKSERHLAVILQVAEGFHRLRYKVDRHPDPIKIDEKRSFHPDLVAEKDGETCYLEVEVGRVDKDSLTAKWENALAAGGRICIVTDKLATLRGIQGSVAQWSTYEGRRVTLYITHLEYLKSRRPGESPWYKTREYAPD